MTLDIITPTKFQWESFIHTHPEANFLSSWNWGVFHSLLGKNVNYDAFSRRRRIQGVCLSIVETARRARYLTIAGGPIIDWTNQSLTKQVFDTIIDRARSNHCSFIRIRPQLFDTPANRRLFSSFGFKPAPMHLTADLTLQLDLTQSLNHLLSQMRKSTRYDINRSSKLNITTTISTKPQDIKPFFRHQQQLARKHGFIPFSYPYLYQQFKTFVADDQAALIHSYHHHRLLATAFIIFYNHEAVYHYGISTPENHHLPGAYACQWRALQEAKSRGMTRYNFWGIAPSNASATHRFSGVSLFKRGFGGQEIAYLPAHDLPLSTTYHLTKIFEQLRSKIRRLS